MASPAHLLDFSRFSPLGLRALPRSLAACKDWDRLVEILTDLGFVESNCIAGVVADLLDAYRASLAALPELTEATLSRQRQLEHISRYVCALGEHAAQATNTTSASRGTLSSKSPKGSPMPPCAVALIDRDSMAGSLNGVEKPYAREDRLKAFADFVDAEGHVLEKYARHPGFCVQQAAKAGRGGPVEDAAQARLGAVRSCPLLVEQPGTRVPFTPRRALLRTTEVPSGSCSVIAMSATGECAVTGGMDGVLRVWDLFTGRSESVKGPGSGIRSIDMTPDGRLAVTGDQDGALVLWDVRARAVRWTATAHEGAVSGVAINAIGNRALSCGEDACMRYWDLGAQSKITDLSDRRPYPVRCVAMNSDGILALSGHQQDTKDPQRPLCTLRLWDLRSGQLLQSFWHYASVHSVAMTRDGHLLLCGDSRGTISLWTGDSPTPVQEIEAHARAVAGLTVSDDTSVILSLDVGGELKLWERGSGKCHRVIRAHSSGGDVAASANSAVIMTVGAVNDRHVRTWDLRGNHEGDVQREHDVPVHAVRLLPKRNRAISGAGDRILQWDLEAGYLVCDHEYPGRTGAGFGFSFSSGCSVGIGNNDAGRVMVWTPGDALGPRGFGPRCSVWDCSITPDGTTAVISRFDRTLQLWDIRSEALRGTEFRHRFPTSKLWMLADGRHILASSKDGVIRVHDFVTGVTKTAMRSPGSTGSPLLAPDDRTAVFGVRGELLRLADIRLGTWDGGFNDTTANSECRALTPDGRYAVVDVTGSRTPPCFEVWNLRTLRRTCEIAHLDCAQQGATVSCDGQLLATHGATDMIRIWSLVTGECLAILHESRGVASLSPMLPDGRIAIGCRTGEVAVMQLRNIALDAPIVTAAVRWHFASGSQCGDWEDTPTVTCPWCEKDILIRAGIREAIVDIHSNAHIRPDEAPCLCLPDDAWNDARLLSTCPRCQHPIRFNPFIVDWRTRAVEPKRRSPGARSATVDPNPEPTRPVWRRRCCRCQAEMTSTRTLFRDQRALCRSCVIALGNTPADDWKSQGDTDGACSGCGANKWHRAVVDRCGLICISCIAGMLESEAQPWVVTAPSHALLTEALQPQAKYADRLCVLWRCREAYDSAVAASERSRERFLEALVAALGFEQDHPLSYLTRVLAIDACITLGDVVLSALQQGWETHGWRYKVNAAISAARIDPRDERVQELLKRAAHDPDARVREFVPDAVLHWEAPWTKEIVDGLMDDQEQTVRDAATHVMDEWELAAGIMSKRDQEFRQYLDELLEKEGVRDILVRLPRELFNYRGTWVRKLAARLAEDVDANVRREAGRLVQALKDGVNPWSQERPD
jgi:WD40 repeat protein